MTTFSEIKLHCLSHNNWWLYLNTLVFVVSLIVGSALVIIPAVNTPVIINNHNHTNNNVSNQHNQTMVGCGLGLIYFIIVYYIAILVSYYEKKYKSNYQMIV